MGEACEVGWCGFVWDDVSPDDIAPRVRRAASGIGDALRMGGAGVSSRVSGGWSALEYAGHVRDVLLNLRDRLVVALNEDNPIPKGMYGGSRVDLGLYAGDAPEAIANELEVAAGLFGRTWERIPVELHQRTMVYGWPTVADRDLRWVAAQALHELEHHAADIRGLLAEHEPPPPVTVSSMASQLRELGVESGDVVVVHSSMRSLGFVVGGAQAVVDALLEVIGPTGTLTMPSHSSDWTDPALWVNPPVPESWWPVIAAECPPYDPYATPMFRMGAIPQALFGRRQTVRSAHPSVSHMAFGPHASAICGSHPLDDGFGDTSPLARLYDLDAKVLLLGVGHDSNTSLHLAENRANWPAKRTFTQRSAVSVEGERRWVEHTELDRDTDDFVALGAEFESTGQVRTGRVGAASARLMPQRQLVDFATAWFGQHRT